MSNYNLSDNVNDSFAFELRDKKYTMRYPKTGELEEIQNLTIELKAANDSEDTEATKVLNKKLEDYLYGLISPEGHELDIQEALKAENIRVMRNFNKMMQTELAI